MTGQTASALACALDVEPSTCGTTATRGSTRTEFRFVANKSQALVSAPLRHGGSLTKCANPECSVLVFHSGFCVACEKLPVPSAGSN
jgi:hypothetical protein